MHTQLEKNKAVVTRFNKEVIEQGNLQVIDEIVSPDFFNHNAAAVGIDAGPAGFKEFISNVLHVALKDITVDIYEQVAEGDIVVTRKAIKGTQVGDFMGTAANGQQVTMQLIDMVRLKDGQYIEHWRYGQVLSAE